MEPEKFDKKKFDDLFKNLNFSFSTVPIHSFKFSNFEKKETVDEMLQRLDADDAIIDSMTSYPTAERMLNDLFNKEK